MRKHDLMRLRTGLRHIATDGEDGALPRLVMMRSLVEREVDCLERAHNFALRKRLSVVQSAWTAFEDVRGLQPELRNAEFRAESEAFSVMYDSREGDMAVFYDAGHSRFEPFNSPMTFAHVMLRLLKARVAKGLYDQADAGLPGAEAQSIAALQVGETLKAGRLAFEFLMARNVLERPGDEIRLLRHRAEPERDESRGRGSRGKTSMT